MTTPGPFSTMLSPRTLTSRRLAFLVLPIIAAAFAFATPARATVSCFSATLAPPSLPCETAVSPATGSGTFVLDDVAHTLDYKVSFSGLTSAETVSHIHGPASPTVCGGVILLLPNGTPKIGSGTIEHMQEIPINAGNSYINIHTNRFHDGEIRGQLVSVTCPTPAPIVTPTPGALDHFTCYKAGASHGSLKFSGIADPPGVALLDQFGPSTVAVTKPTVLCAPTNKLNEDPSAPTHPDHLKGYKIKGQTPPGLPGNVLVQNQFGSVRVDVRTPSHLLVPTAKDLQTSPPPPAAPAVDHFQCYKVKVTSGTPKFIPHIAVPIEDQFGPLTVDIRKPTVLCAPVNKNNEEPGAEAHPNHLMCYQVKQVGLPKFTAIRGVFVNNQFGPETVDVRKPVEICVPSSKTL